MKSIKPLKLAGGNGNYSELGDIFLLGTSDSREICGISFPVVTSVK